MQRYRALARCWLLGILLGLAGCGPAAPPTATPAEQAAVLAYSEAQTDNLMTAWTSGDYVAFSRDFDAAMQQALTATEFQQSHQSVTGKIGTYVSRQVDHVERRDNGYTVVFYKATFTQDDPVQMRISFGSDPPHKVGGFFFSSAKLSQ